MDSTDESYLLTYPDAMKAGVGIDPDRRAYHMFIKSGFTDDQINHIYGFVYDPDPEGPSAALDPRKIQEAVLRFYDKPWNVDQHRGSRAPGGRKRNFLRTIISLGRRSLLELQAVIERWESYVSRYQKKMKDKLDDEIKLAGLESLVSEKREKHLIL